MHTSCGGQASDWGSVALASPVEPPVHSVWITWNQSTGQVCHCVLWNVRSSISDTV